MRKPEPTTRDEEIKALCALTITRAVELMAEHGAPNGMVIDRMMTFCVASLVKELGRVGAAAALLRVADQIDDPKFDHLDPDLKTVN